MKNAILTGIITTVVGGLVVLFVEHSLKGDQEIRAPLIQSSYPPIRLDLVGSNNKLNIKDGISRGSEVDLRLDGNNLNREVVLARGQPLTLSVTGSNNEIRIDRSIFSQVSVTETGSNNSVQRSF